MATRLQMVFTTSEGDSQMSYNYVKPNISGATVQTVANAIITNGSIFAKVPTAIKSAKLVTTTETLVDLS